MRKLKIKEGIDETGTPDMKYYAFDWDDNILEMPTKIILLNKEGKEVGMSTEDFAEYRSEIGNKVFEYEGEMIVNFAPKAFRNFTVEGDRNFLVDTMIAKPAAAWGDFVEALNGGSIFAIITARGHSPYILKEACYNLIVSNYEGLSSKECVKNLEKYRDFVGEQKSKGDIIREYLDMCKFYPVSYGEEGGAAKPEELKNKALREFITYIKEMSVVLGKKAFLKNVVTNNFLPKLGVSDDDLKNLQSYLKAFGKELKGGEGIDLKLISTRGGKKSTFKDEEKK